jgi:hypothetical protein
MAVAVVGSEDRVGRDPGGVVVGEARKDPRAEHGDERRDAQAAHRVARG